ncbi:PIG-L deacetylase family protein [Paludibaculum fermentans]|uniref:PIG-L family deacetylase n=1 Tax=Paludibaculum fermentans TaxID=1473598 RepID=A0A7S7NXE0_PALFE|nr:PIG-L family deacetylase [Paludibaculum fermentans]QOY91561.1 PIG-L family deacetylase [Paludibaculum fermentans]
MTRRVLAAGVIFGVLAMGQTPAASTRKLRVIAIGAHPDDCDIRFGGTAAKMAKAGHAVKFLAVTNGDAGHQTLAGAALAKRRYLEAQESARRLGIMEYQILDNHDGELLPSLEVRRQVIRAIRQWKADIVLAPRPNDYHPDHRYTGVLVQDAAYMVVVPNTVTDTPALVDNPIFLYVEDNFQKPAPFRPDVVVSIDDTWKQKVDGLDAHVSQVYEWLPWVDHQLDSVPKDLKARRVWLDKWRSGPISDEKRKVLAEEIGAEAAAKVQHVECFELCEYGRRPKLDELRALFPLK